MILDKINEPKDLRSLSNEELKNIASEMRELIIKKVNTIGGHLGPNLGIVEATIAMHYVFDSPKDEIVFDVSHQCYSHKMLTGRKDGYTNERCEDTTLHTVVKVKIKPVIMQNVFENIFTYTIHEDVNLNMVKIK